METAPPATDVTETAPPATDVTETAPPATDVTEAARLATDDDVDRIAELFRLAIAELEPTRGGKVFTVREARPEPVEEGLRSVLADGHGCLVVGTLDDVIIGYAAGHVEELRDGSRLGVIDDLFVEPEARGVAVGEALMAELLAWGRRERCDGMDATALPGNRATKNFFEMNGFSARMIVMHHRFGEPKIETTALDVPE